MKTLEFTTYAHMASALVNGDTSGLREEDGDFELLDEIESYLKEEKAHVVDCSEEAHFSSYMDFGDLAGDILTYICLIH